MGCLCSSGEDRKRVGVKHGKFEKCKKCDTNSDCPGDIEGCNSKLGFCWTCASNTYKEGLMSCDPRSTSIPKNTQKSCKTDLDCKKPCICNARAGNNCMQLRTSRKQMLTCKTCASNSDCVGSTCDETKKKCVICGADAIIDAIYACHSVLDSADISGTINSSSQELAPIVSPAENSAAMNSNVNVCISTSWLRERGLEHAAICHAGTENVLCIPGLPCATSGHILR